jgi:ArsR family transcriptional regulator
VVDSTTVEVSLSESCDLLAAVAEPVRLAILHRLADAPSCVCDLQSSLDIAPNLLSYHLRMLRDAGLVRGTKRGRWVDYELAPDALDRLHATMPRMRTEG